MKQRLVSFLVLKLTFEVDIEALYGNIYVSCCIIFFQTLFFFVSVCLFMLRFYDPVNPMGSCRARSVYLTPRLLGRLNSLSG